MITKICPICGTEFTTEKGNHKFCSDACRIEGAKLARKEWEDRTGFREKQREKMRLYRAQVTAEKAKKRAELRAKRQKELQEKQKQITLENRKREQKLIEAGDPRARMRQLTPSCLEYWIAFQEAELNNSIESGEPSSTTVNGISIYVDHFPEEALQSVKDRGIIMISRDNR